MSSPPPVDGFYRTRPSSSRMNSDNSATSSKSSGSNQSLSPAPHHPRSELRDTALGPGMPTRGPQDQSAFASPMRKLLLTMAPIAEGIHERRKPVTEFYTWENLPSQDSVRACVEAYYGGRGIAHILCPIPESETTEMIQSIYNTTKNNGPIRQGSRIQEMNHRICQVLLIAAVGTQYLEPFHPDKQAALFTSGKWYLDMAFGRHANDLQRLRANVLTGLHLIFEKRIIATEYLRCAIAIGMAWGLHRCKPPLSRVCATTPSLVSDADHDEISKNWAYWKRIWQSLVFLDGWLSTSLGSVPQICKISEPISEERAVLRPTNEPSQNGGGGSDLEYDLHASLASLGFLMCAITKDVICPGTVPLDSVRVCSDRLRQWHANLPSSLTLSTAVQNQYESTRKNSTLLLHCAYLGSIAHLTRRLLVERVTDQLTRSSGGGGVSSGAHGAALAEANETAEEFAKMCVSAARQLATVVGMLRAENGLTRRCWLIIQSAYTAAIVICLDISCRRGRPMLESAFIESLELISKCMATLQRCAPFDPVSQRYLDILMPIYRTLSVPEPTGTARLYINSYTAPFGDPVSEKFPGNEIMLDHILDLLKAPYGGESIVIDQDLFTAAGHGNISEHYRFIYNPPENSKFIAQHRAAQRHPHYPHQAPRNQFSSTDGGSRGIRVGNSPFDNPTTPREYPLRNREEYEAFFRRTT